MFGAFAAQYSTDTYGRRKTFIVAAVGFIIGVLVMTFSNSYKVLMLGRVFVGLGVGVGLAVSSFVLSFVCCYRGRAGHWCDWYIVIDYAPVVLTVHDLIHHRSIHFILPRLLQRNIEEN